MGKVLTNLKNELRSKADPKKANFLARYFKTGKGQYAEGDVFLGGIVTSEMRKIANKYQDIPLRDIQALLKSKFHEERSLALGILNRQFTKAKNQERLKFYKFYLQNTKHINNWDLVDISAGNIVGEYLIANPQKIGVLKKLARSKSLWERRIAIMATFTFIKKGQFQETLTIGEMLLTDKHDLIHKAVGWMLREVGKKDQKAEEAFLKKHYQTMPRTMLRYAIEKFPEKTRKKYLLGQI